MAAAHRRVVYQAVCVLSALLLRQQCADQYPICNKECCTCDLHGAQLSCDCPDLDELTLHRADIPRTMQTISIRNTREVVIEKQAINGLSSLENFTLLDVGKLTVEHQGMTRNMEANLRLVNISSVEEMHIWRSAFNGSWQPEAKITIQAVGTLHVEEAAFSYHSTYPGPDLEIRNVRSLIVLPQAFSARFDHLRLVNVSMKSCGGQSFAGDIRSLDLIGVRIRTVTAGCVSGQRGWGRLTIRSCGFDSVQTLAFSGKIPEVVIERSNFTEVQSNAFFMNVSRLQINGSSFQNIATNGLAVHAIDSVALMDVRVELLQKDALVGLRLDTTTCSKSQPLLIRDLHISSVKNGSLAFRKGVPVCLARLVLDATCCECPTERLTRHLVGAGPAEQLSQAQLQVFQQLLSSCPCPAAAVTPRLAAAVSPVCPSDAAADSRDAGGQDAQRLLAIGCGVGALLLLLVVVLAAALVLRRRTRATPRSRRPHIGHRSVISWRRLPGGGGGGLAASQSDRPPPTGGRPAGGGQSSDPGLQRGTPAAGPAVSGDDMYAEVPDSFLSSPPAGRQTGNRPPPALPAGLTQDGGGQQHGTVTAGVAAIDDCDYAEVQDVVLAPSLSGPPLSQGQRDSEEPPPLPPITRERMLPVVDIVDNELYSSVDG